MILPTKRLEDFHRKVVMVDGTFDPLHEGHIAYFKAAKDLNKGKVLCNITGDRYLLQKKGRPALLPATERAVVIDQLRPVDYVHTSELSTVEVLDLLQPVAYVKGSDWNKMLPPEQKKLCKEKGIEVILLDTKFNSSSSLIERFVAALRTDDFTSQVDRYEKYVLAQKPFDPEHYDEEYFLGNWRLGENSYDIEVRRRIEAKNPANIIKVFHPKTVLDWGCGPGALMLFLNELGAEVYGVDFSTAAVKAAPKQVKEHIHVGSIDQYFDFGVDFDLAICREVIEHLTMTQTISAIHVLAAQYRPRFIYLTTRYHPSPDSLVSITADDPKVDPSHINLTNKQFLRVLFVSYGYKTRQDLEKQLDWKGYGRVLVFERK